ncbi:thioester domain-containing protein [Frigoribacterium sp. PvP032]|uniref:thioester domain-containing protein n=1 Tax=Frigoribacterium sp. PvP032 TaxID=2806589 RepID=UPI001AE37BCB|nr:thioester domain-containing protein [Frigoribacterium sp. PvP032]MBP1191855.1 hypothetical protein [Frigoribacterium sp. PvP032]
MTPQTTSTRPSRQLLLPLLLLLVAVLVAPLAFASPASAVASTGLGTGYIWRGDGVSYLGTYLLADGRKAFCLEAGKTSPVGNEYDTATGADVFPISSEDHARLAYIARTWAGTDDQDTAAAGQLAVWSITGLAGQTARYYAGRANERWPIVLEKMQQMLDESTREASTSVSASLAVDLQPDGTGTLRTDVVVDRVTGGPTVLEPTFAGAVSLTGAVFTDGTAASSARNGETMSFRATGDLPEMTVGVESRFDDLPYGRVMTVGSSAAGSQMILFSGGASVTATGTASASALSPLPFRPRVSTVTSDTVAEQGAVLTDQLTLAVEPGDGLLSEWGRIVVDGGWAPIPVTVRSRLLGPFSERPVEAADWPADAPVVCDVEVRVVEGPGTYTTPGCELPGGGWYTWVESIDPADTSVEDGRDRLRGWKSPFGTATETTVLPWSPRIDTAIVGASVVEPGACVSDALLVSGWNTEVEEVVVDTLLIGPFAELPAEGTELGDVDGLERDGLVAGRVSTTVNGDGLVETACLPVAEVGDYAFVYTSEGTPAGTEGHQVVPAFADTRVHDTESFRVEAPVDTPVETEAPAVPVALAFTGTDLGGLALGISLAGGLLIAGGIAGHVVRRRRHAASGRSAELGPDVAVDLP